MDFELQMVVWTTVLLFTLLVFQGGLTPLSQGFSWGLGSRDEPRELTAMQGRAARTVANHIEGMVIFVPLVLVANAIDLSTPLTVWGAGVYLAGRVVFTGLYLGGVAVLRSAVWGISTLGIMLIGYEVIRVAI